MIDIWLVRHGEASAGWDVSPDPGLSALGTAQARQAGDHLLSLVPDSVSIVSSPLLRAQETATPFAQHMGLSVTLDAAFRELPSPVPLAERHAWLKTFMHQSWLEQLPEQWAWRERIIEALGVLQTPTVIFTHFMVINAVLAHVSQKTATVQALPANGSVHHFQLSETGELGLASLGEQLSSDVL